MWTAFGLDSKQRDKRSTTRVSRKKVNLIPLRLRPALFVSSDYAELMLFLILTIDYVLCSELPKEVNRYWRTKKKKKIILWVLHSYTQTNSIQANTKVLYHATCTALCACSCCSALKHSLQHVAFEHLLHHHPTLDYRTNFKVVVTMTRLGSCDNG